MLRSLCGSRPSPRIGGFTLQETLVVLLVGGTLATGGSSAIRLLQESRKTAAANDLVTHLNLARSEAIKRHERVAICASNDQASCTITGGSQVSWRGGWVVYVDANRNGKLDADEVLRIRPPLSRNLSIHTSAARYQVAYQPTGTSGGSTVTFAVCDSRGAKFARYVIVSNSGRARVASKSDSTVRC